MKILFSIVSFLTLFSVARSQTGKPKVLLMDADALQPLKEI
jgi:hypothetical protein